MDGENNPLQLQKKLNRQGNDRLVARPVGQDVLDRDVLAPDALQKFTLKGDLDRSQGELIGLDDMERALGFVAQGLDDVALFHACVAGDQASHFIAERLSREHHRREKRCTWSGTINSD